MWLSEVGWAPASVRMHATCLGLRAMRGIHGLSESRVNRCCLLFEAPAAPAGVFHVFGYARCRNVAPGTQHNTGLIAWFVTFRKQCPL